MDFWKSLAGMVRVELCSADPMATVTAAGKRGISLYETEYLDTLRLGLLLPRRQLNAFVRLAEKRGDSVKIMERRGLYFLLMGFLRRPVLVLGLLFVLTVSLWVPSRVFFVRVEGNREIQQRLIVEKASACGIGFGASRRQVRSEKIKNALLEALPELQWAGVNTYGCTAVITVRERTDLETTPEPKGVSSIVAGRDAIIDSITVYQGNALCKPGQAVKAGQMLVSGYQDCGLSIRAVRAKADIFGYTQRKSAALFPTQYAVRREKQGQTKKFSLIIGKKRINFYKGSGISGTTCAKIYEEYYITLPGSFVLPIGWSVETEIDYRSDTETQRVEEVWLQAFLQSDIRSRMIAGRICESREELSEGEGVLRMDATYSCYEWICVSRPEESVSNYE